MVGLYTLQLRSSLAFNWHVGSSLFVCLSQGGAFAVPVPYRFDWTRSVLPGILLRLSTHRETLCDFIFSHLPS